MSVTSSLHHIVFSTRHRKPVIPPASEEALYRYIWAIVREYKSTLLRIGGMSDHLHLLIDLHPSVALASLIADIKRKSSLWMKRSGLFPLFEGWGREYFAFSKSAEHKETIINYIKNQKNHHTLSSFDDEIRSIVDTENLDWRDEMLS